MKPMKRVFNEIVAKHEALLNPPVLGEAATLSAVSKLRVDTLTTGLGLILANNLNGLTRNDIIHFIALCSNYRPVAPHVLLNKISLIWDSMEAEGAQ